MKILRPLSIVCCVMWTASTAAQISLTPPVVETKRAQPPKPKPKPPARKPAATAKPAATPPSAATVTPAPAPDDPNLDLVYGAYQRGMYKTAFDLASKRAQDTGDPKSMTMLGEL
ncbi:MAG: HcpA family protein, partial [Bradyrhizobium sp.]